MRLLVSTFIFFLFAYQSQAREFIVTAKVSNPTHKELRLSHEVDNLNDEGKTYLLKLNDNNEVNTLIYLSNQVLVTISYGDVFFKVYVYDLERLHFTFDANNVIETLEFSGEGAGTNNVFNDLRKEFREAAFPQNFKKGYMTCYFPKKIVKNAQTQDFETYKAELIGYKTRAFDILKARKAEVDGFMYEIFLDRIYREISNYFMAYFIVNQDKYTAEQIGEMTDPAIFFEGINITEDVLLEYPSYRNFLKTYVYFSYLNKDSKEPNTAFAFYDIIERRITGQSQDWMKTKLLLNAKKEEFTALAEQKYARFKNTSPQRTYIDRIEEAYGNLATLDPNATAPDFSLVDEYGNTVKLSDYRGEVVYISFWATWCQPCITGFRKTEQTRKVLQDRGIVLMNVSLDSSPDVWKNTMSRVPMPGVNLHVGEEENLRKLYDLSKLPAYFIIDKEGSFAYLSDEANRNILEEFDALLNE